MRRRVVDYDRLADGYDQRYALHRLEGVAAALHQTLARTPHELLLEVGCGTGRWLSELAARARFAVGLDRSVAMLLRVPAGESAAALVNGSGDRIPFRQASFDLVLCVNAIQHLKSPAGFVRDAADLVRPRGALAIVGLDPHRGADRWYLYEYFPECRTLDLERYPSTEQLREWMAAADLRGIEVEEVERIRRRFTGGEILEDYFLQRQASSQLAILSEEAWAEGLHGIRRALEEGESRGAPTVFEVDLHLFMVCGWRAGTDQ